MVIESAVIVGYLIAWAVRKARRVGERLDGEFDVAVDAGLDRLHDAISSKLGPDSLRDIEEQAGEFGQVTEGTQRRAEEVIAAASTTYPEFAAQIAKILAEIKVAEAGQASAVASGTGSVAIGGDADLNAQSGGVAAITIAGGVNTTGKLERP
ncbi:hypothetical protein [Nocardia sp. NPDC052112]|uniref:hypothetical protein n=1 Tax=Nocardia sp. NPDC052112 TaxID=3155646 RepID=UPI003431BC16